MTLADDLRAAADYVYECSGGKISLLALSTRLRAHAETIQRVEREMRKTGGDGCGLPYELIGWANALGDFK